MKKAVLATMVLFCTNAASAEPFTEQELKDAAKPVPGVATATLAGNPPWCDALGKVEDRSFPSSIAHRSTNSLSDLVSAAHDICANATDPTWRRFAASQLQQLMNWTHQSQADAERSLRARVQTDKWKAQHDELCKALAVSPEAAAEVKTFGDARLELFGCNMREEPLWISRSGSNTEGVNYYLDPALQPDPLMRLYWLEAYLAPQGDQKLPSTDPMGNRSLVEYAIAAPDVAKVDRGALDKLMQAPPYNEYARVVLSETLGDLAAKSKFYEAAIDTLTKGDADYETILRKAPQQAYADWDKLVAQWRPEIERSAAFEQLWSAPSRKAMKGCSPPLLKDAEKVVKQFKDVTYHEMVEKLEADPIANLLFARIAVCTAYDGVGGIPGVLKQISDNSRHLRGPHTLAAWAIFEAVTLAKKDRPRMVLDLDASRLIGTGERHFDDRDLDYDGAVVIESDRDRVVQGIVGATTKTDEGTKITFKKTGFKFQNYECKDTNKIERIENGRVFYQQVCHNLPGTTSVDRTPEPIMVPTELAGVVKPGMFISVAFRLGSWTKSHVTKGAPMYTKKASTDSKILSFYGLAI